MPSSWRWLLLVALIWLGLPLRSPAPLIFTPGEGWRYEQVGASRKWEKARAKDQLEVAEKALEEGDHNLVIKASKRVINRWPYSDYTPKARYLLGRAYEAKGQDERAFKTYQKLIERNPKIENYEEILQRQFEIANRYYDGKWFKLWNVIPAFPSMTKTIGLYGQIVTNGPYSSVAPQAQLRIGDAYEKKFIRSYAEAAKAYDRAADRYRDTALGTDAMFKTGLAYNKQAKTSEYDQSIAAKAIAVFTDFVTLHPQDPRVTEAQDYVSALRTEQARGSFEIAKYYEGKKRWKAALIYYNEVLLKDPNSTHAEAARRSIDSIQARLPPTAVEP